MEKISDSNYELWLLRYAEGELTVAEREAVECWLESHPEAAEELSLYNEAPRLERNDSVVYGPVTQPRLSFLTPQGRRPQFISYLSPFLRWSAAAAVVVALMVPALRMETMGHVEVTAPTSLVAEAKSTAPKATSNPKISRTLKAPRDPKDFKDSEDIKVLKEEEPIEAFAALPDAFESKPVLEPIFIEVNSLIVFESDEVSGDTLYTTALITYESTADWGDALLAANDAFHEDLDARPLGRFVSRQLPDSRRLKEKVVEPLREKIDNVKNIIK